MKLIFFLNIKKKLEYKIPVTFLIVQKSKALKTITRIKIIIECEKNIFKNKNENNANPLKRKVKIQAIGCDAFDKSKLNKEFFTGLLF